MEQATTGKPNIYTRALLTIGITCAFSWSACLLATDGFSDYAMTLFFFLPFVLGCAATLIYGYKRTVARKKLFNVSLITLSVFCVGVLTFAWEGLICLVMAFPLGLFFTWVGHWVGYEVLKRNVSQSTLPIWILFAVTPALMAFEHQTLCKGDLRSVVTSIEIEASPEEVWENVIQFPQLNDPTEFIFKTGIAYPINATIKGKGVGAVRLCNFSMGSFVELITVWDEPKLLKFSVEEQPAPMKELSPYDIKPNHLHGYWVSKHGQFRLTRLRNGNTLLEGTTWYVNKIKPDIYWTLWSDYIVHKIHNRVLAHIKKHSEAKTSSQ